MQHEGADLQCGVSTSFENFSIFTSHSANIWGEMSVKRWSTKAAVIVAPSAHLATRVLLNPRKFFVFVDLNVAWYFLQLTGELCHY
jgi:hypothetical protein